MRRWRFSGSGRISRHRRVDDLLTGTAAAGGRSSRTAGWFAVLRCGGGRAVLLPLTTVLAAAVLARNGEPCATAAVAVAVGGWMRAESWKPRLDVLVGELRVGAHPAQAFAVAADETAGPVADSCRAVAARARLGADVTAGLRGVAETSALPAQWDRLAVCWQLAAEHGLAMSTLMRAAQRDIVERQRFSGQVMSAMAGRARHRCHPGGPADAVGVVRSAHRGRPGWHSCWSGTPAAGCWWSG